MINTYWQGKINIIRHIYTMNSTDCSVNNNPLFHLNKQTQQNDHFVSSQLRQNVGSPSSQQRPVESFKSSQNVVSERNMMDINKFTNSSIGEPLRFGQVPTRTPAVSGSWFVPKKQSSNISRSPLDSTTSNYKDWSKEFNVHRDVNPVTKDAHTFQNRYQNDQILHSYNTSLRSPIYQGSTRIENKQQASQASSLSTKQDADWDQQFGDLEKEVFEHFHINETAPEKPAEIAEESQVKKDDIIIDDTYQAEFQKVWDSIHEDAEDLIPDRSKYLLSRMTGNMEYKFEDDMNEYLNNPNAYKIGCILMENGAKLSEAAMAFEAAVKEDPSHVDAWLRLGLVQTQNEKELNGICALEKCLKLDPNNIEAMKNLAISYINEGYDMSALTILNRWISAKYPQLEVMSQEGDDVLVDETMYDQVNINQKITKRFLNLSTQLPQIDPDVQLCLGLLYYANDNYEKTIDCFNAALEVNPNDELMWNRLGAALANSNRSEDSIQAYHKALELKPSFVRARYNLAVSCLNIGCHKEAAEHLLTTLSMHEVEGLKAQQEHSYESYNNDNIIETMKRVFVAMNRNDLLEKVKPGMNLSQFRGEFTF